MLYKAQTNRISFSAWVTNPKEGKQKHFAFSQESDAHLSTVFSYLRESWVKTCGFQPF